MPDTSIRACAVSKQYRIGIKRERYKTLRDSVIRTFTLPIRAVTRARFQGLSPPPETIWALKDVSFEVERGEVVGVIGRNGAGKSTLLKILSRITEPTEGYAEIRGRVGSLLEVGTGFHSELTGRENIFLSGAILGMRRAEILRRFDEMVAFSELEKFVDTPVKHYSSGMYLRLAFAVAAHLESETLLMDELLAVGDAAFQKKCLGKMGDVSREGRTVLFVSHNMAAINQLCHRCVVLNEGSLWFDGPSSLGIEQYLRLGDGGTRSAVIDMTSSRMGRAPGVGKIVRVELQNDDGVNTISFGIGERFVIKVDILLDERLFGVSLGIEVKSPTGMPLLNLRTDSQGLDFGPYEAGDLVTFTIRIPGLPFYPGVYKIEPWFAERGGKRIDQIQDGISVVIEATGRYQSERKIQEGKGVIIMDCSWSDKVQRHHDA